MFTIVEMEYPLVSIILPTRNSDRFLRETLDCVLAQTYPNWELLVIDANSTDRTKEILSLLATDKRAKVMVQSTRGLGAARNEAAVHARGDFIAFVDSDDIWRPNKLEIHVKVMSKVKVDLTFSGWRRINESGISLGILRKPADRDYQIEDLVIGSGISTPSTVLITREKFTALGGFSKQIGIAEDIDLWLRLLLSDGRIRGIPLVLNDYRLHSGQMTQSLKSYEEARLGILSFVELRAPKTWLKIRSLAWSNHHRAMAYARFWSDEPKLGLRHMVRSFRAAPFRTITDLRMLITWLALLSLFLPRKIRVAGTKTAQRILSRWST